MQLIVHSWHLVTGRTAHTNTYQLFLLVMHALEEASSHEGSLTLILESLSV